MTGGWRELHNKELHNINIIRMVKLRRMIQTGHVARMWIWGMLIEYWCEIKKERYQ
jgi:hypothetical protein